MDLYVQSRTWIEINEPAFQHNIKQLVRCCGSTQLGVVLKANAYGHGMIPMARLAQNHADIAWILVAATHEAIILRKEGITKPILVLSYHDSDLAEAIMLDIALVTYCDEMAHKINDAAQKVGKAARVHIKVDTDMSRLGVQPQNITQYIQTLRALKSINVEGIFTHFCDTNNLDLSFTVHQQTLFDQIIRAHREFRYVHAVASGALMLEQKYDMARIGTNMYGFWKSPVQKQRFESLWPGMTLRPLLSWKTKIIQIKHLEAGSTVGYNRSFRAPYHMITAALPIGFFDGYPRDMSNRGSVMEKIF